MLLLLSLLLVVLMLLLLLLLRQLLAGRLYAKGGWRQCRRRHPKPANLLIFNNTLCQYEAYTHAHVHMQSIKETRVRTLAHMHTHARVYSVYTYINVYISHGCVEPFGSDLTRDLKSQCSHLGGNFRMKSSNFLGTVSSGATEYEHYRNDSNY